MPMINVSEKKREANARNAQRSTGPRTREGKQRSSRNAVTHGCASTMLCKPVYGEPEDHYASTLARLMQAWNPADDKEAQLVEAIAITWVRIQRSERWESTILNSVMDTRARKTAVWLLKKGREPQVSLDPDLGACIAMVDKNDGAPMWQQNQRHSTKAWREWQKAVDTLRKMQDKRLSNAQTLNKAADMGSNCTGEIAVAAAASSTAQAQPAQAHAAAVTVPVAKQQVVHNETALGSNCHTSSVPAQQTARRNWFSNSTAVYIGHAVTTAGSARSSA